MRNCRLQWHRLKLRRGRFNFTSVISPSEEEKTGEEKREKKRAEGKIMGKRSWRKEKWARTRKGMPFIHLAAACAHSLLSLSCPFAPSLPPSPSISIIIHSFTQQFPLTRQIYDLKTHPFMESINPPKKQPFYPSPWNSFLFQTFHRTPSMHPSIPK